MVPTFVPEKACVVKTIKRFGLEYYGVFYRGTLLKTRNSKAFAQSDAQRFNNEFMKILTNDVSYLKGV